MALQLLHPAHHKDRPAGHMSCMLDAYNSLQRLQHLARRDVALRPIMSNQPAANTSRRRSSCHYRLNRQTLLPPSPPATSLSTHVPAGAKPQSSSGGDDSSLARQARAATLPPPLPYQRSISFVQSRPYFALTSHRIGQFLTTAAKVGGGVHRLSRWRSI